MISLDSGNSSKSRCLSLTVNSHHAGRRPGKTQSLLLATSKLQSLLLATSKLQSLLLVTSKLQSQLLVLLKTMSEFCSSDHPG